MELVSHEATGMMFRNNKGFYDGGLNKEFDIKLFRRSLKSAENIVAFLAFGKIFKEETVIRLLTKWVPNYRAKFWWFVVKKGCGFKKVFP